MIERVDPFIGTEATDLPPAGLAETWWWPKPQVGNTHPGATYPLGMVSACAYSGAYPTGYGRYDLGTEGLPTRAVRPAGRQSGFTHFQQSGTGAIRKYYNYFRVTPMLQPLDDLGSCWDVVDEGAEPGYYAATLDSGIRCEITVGPEERRPPVHVPGAPRRPAGHRLLAGRPGHPARPDGAAAGAPALHRARGRAGRDRRRGRSAGHPRGVRRPALAAAALVRPAADARRHAAGLRPDPADDAAAVRADVGGAVGTRAGGRAAVRVLAAGRRPGAARTSSRTCGAGPVQLRRPRRARRDRRAWREHLGKIPVDTPSTDKQTVFSTALYHSLIKPCLAPDESPFWPADGPFAFDIATMWDIYRTQLPLLTTLMPDKAVELANALLYICEEEGNLPIGYRMARGADRFCRQGSALAHTFLADLCQLGLPGIDWDWALVHMHNDLRRTYGEDFLLRGMAHPISHTLDLAFGYWCTSQIARARRRPGAGRAVRRRWPTRWVNAFDAETGLLQRLRPTTRAAAGTTRSGCCTTWRRASSSPVATTPFVAHARPVLRVRRRPVKQPGAARRRGDGRRVRAEPVRGPEQRAGHGGAVVLPLRRPARPDRRGGAGHRAEPVRHRAAAGCPATTTPAGCLVVRVGVARAVPGRRAEPVPDQRARRGASRASTSATGTSRSRPPDSSNRSPTVRRSTSSPCTSTACRSNAPGSPRSCTAAAAAIAAGRPCDLEPRPDAVGPTGRASRPSGLPVTSPSTARSARTQHRRSRRLGERAANGSLIDPVGRAEPPCAVCHRRPRRPGDLRALG